MGFGGKTCKGDMERYSDVLGFEFVGKTCKGYLGVLGFGLGGKTL